MESNMPPPLEDMSADLSRIRKSRFSAPTLMKPARVENHTATKIAVKNAPKQKMFSGLAGGFFQSSRTTGTNKKASIPFVKKNSSLPSGPNLVFNDVQEAMKNTLKKGEWMDNDLLMRVATSPLIQRRMKEPRFQEALNLMQKNPKEAMSRYASDVEVQEFLRAFMAILGDHFTKLGSKQDVPA